METLSKLSDTQKYALFGVALLAVVLLAMRKNSGGGGMSSSSPVAYPGTIGGYPPYQGYVPPQQDSGGLPSTNQTPDGTTGGSNAYNPVPKPAVPVGGSPVVPGKRKSMYPDPLIASRYAGYANRYGVLN